MTTEPAEDKKRGAMSRPMPKSPPRPHRPEGAGKVRPQRSKARIQRHQGR
jgi:hypothetical protein